MRRAITTVLSLVLLALGAQAQFIGYVSPQTVQQTLATNQTCTGAAQIYNINNLGQGQHWLSVASLTGIQKFQAEIDGIDNQGNVYRISDVIEMASILAAIPQGSVNGQGYFPKLRVAVTCSPNTGTYTASYSGGWGTSPNPTGSYLSAQIDHVLFVNANATINQSDAIQTPYGSSAGTIFFQYSNPGTGGSINVQCFTNVFTSIGQGPPIVLNVSLANTANLQVFQVPDTSCPFPTITYGAGTATGTVAAEYIFSTTGRGITAPGYQYGRVTGTTATAIKGSPGFVHTLNINTANAAAGTVSIFDLVSSACTGTPSTNKVAVITTPASVNGLPPYIFDVNAFNGICVQASQTMDITVSFQ